LYETGETANLGNEFRHDTFVILTTSLH